jgi:hypothetical protein
MSHEPIMRVMDKHVDELMAHAGVVGVAVGMTAAHVPCIQVLVIDLTDELRDSIPAEIEGHPVIIEVTGEIRGMPGGDE